MKPIDSLPRGQKIKPRAKRLILKVSVLAVLVNTVLLFVQHKEQGRLLPHDYLVAAESLATTAALIGVLVFMFSRLSRGGKDERR